MELHTLSNLEVKVIYRVIYRLLLELLPSISQLLVGRLRRYRFHSLQVDTNRMDYNRTHYLELPLLTELHTLLNSEVKVVYRRDWFRYVLAACGSYFLVQVGV